MEVFVIVQTRPAELTENPANNKAEHFPFIEATPYYSIEELRSDGGFVRKIRALLHDLQTTTDIETDLRISFVWPSIVPVAVADNLGAIVEEALANIRLTGAATRVEVQLRADVDSALLVLRDNGRRSPWSGRVREQEAALSAIQGRAAQLVAHVEIVESEGRGSKLRVVLPPW